MKILFFTKYSLKGSSSRYRMYQYLDCQGKFGRYVLILELLVLCSVCYGSTIAIHFSGNWLIMHRENDEGR